MNDNSELIIMLTYNDITVKNAYEIFESSKDSKAKIWGFKEIGIPLEEMKTLFAYMKEWGKTTVLEVVAYTEEECMEGAKMAKECNCDMLIGTLYYDSINSFCKENNIKYMPFIGDVSNRPSVLNGTIKSMLEQANNYLSKDVYGINILGYRYTGDAVKLNKELTSQINAPVCLAGSIDSYERLSEVKDANPKYFTIGTAFFDNKFGGTFKEQIDKVCDYMKDSSDVRGEANDKEVISA
jgi:hypothetical protein